MKALIAKPVYRRVSGQWSRLRARHWLFACLGVLGLAVVVAGLPLAGYLPCFPTRMPIYPWSTPALAAIHSLFVGQALLTGLIVCVGALLGSISVSQTEDLLPLTPLAPRAIALARLAAVIRVLLIPLAIVTLVRLGLMLAVRSGLLERLYAFTALVPSVFGCPFMLFAPPVARALGDESYRLLYASLWRMDVLHMKRVWPVWAASYVLRPWLDVALFAAIGTAVSTRAKTRRQALMGMWAATIGAAGMAYVARRAAALGLSTLWLASVDLDVRALWLPPWDFGGGIDPPGWLASVWTMGLPVVTPGFVESARVFEILWPVGEGVKAACLGLILHVAGQRASTRS